MPERGYYSVIQYCPDLSRLEAANVGVILLCPAKEFLKCRLAPIPTRAERFFGPLDHASRMCLDSAMKAIEERLMCDKTELLVPANLEAYGDTRANEIRLTELRTMRVDDPQTELDRLYEELVPEPQQSKGGVK